MSGLRLRKTPDASGPQNIIEELAEGQEVSFEDGPWLRVKKGGVEGWVHYDYVSGDRPPSASIFRIDVANLPSDNVTQTVRKEIKDEFGLGKAGEPLNCTEYVTYRVKTKLGITIQWPVKSGRNGGVWAQIFKKHGTYKTSAEPKPDSAICFTDGISRTGDPKVNAIGHVAFVEVVFPDQSIKISEANWPRNGIYNERVLTKAEWQDKYKAAFVHFSA